MPDPNEVYGTSNGFNSLKRLFDSFYNGDVLSEEFFAVVLEVLPSKKTRDKSADWLFGLVSGYEYATEFFARALAPVSAESSVYTPHDFLLNPCSPTDYQKIKDSGVTLQSVIRNHTKFTITGDSPDIIKKNTIVKVKFSFTIIEGRRVPNMSTGVFVSIATPTEIKSAQLGIPAAVGCDDGKLSQLVQAAVSSGTALTPSAGAVSGQRGYLNLFPYQVREANRVQENKITHVVLHASAGNNWPKGTNEGLNRYLFSGADGRSASWHYSVDGGGNVANPIPDKDIAWHCGGYNYEGIGIEMVGHPHRVNYGDKSGKPMTVRGTAGPGYGFMYNEPMIDACTTLVADLCTKYNIPPDASGIILHENVSGDRTDPGVKYGNFDFDDFLTRVRSKMTSGV